MLLKNILSAAALISAALASPLRRQVGALITYSGRLEVRNSAGTSLGFVRNDPDEFITVGGLTAGAEGDIQVTLTASASSTAPIDILATNPSFAYPFYIGAAGSFRFPGIKPGVPHTLQFTNVEQTPPNSLPVASPIHGALVESSIWTFNHVTFELHPQYINPDNTTRVTILAYEPVNNRLFFTGDLALYNAGTGNSAIAVKLFLADI